MRREAAVRPGDEPRATREWKSKEDDTTGFGVDRGRESLDGAGQAALVEEAADSIQRWGGGMGRESQRPGRSRALEGFARFKVI